MFSFLSSAYQALVPYVPPGIVTCLAAAGLGEGKHVTAWRHEFVGTFLMIGLTFSPGKWIGRDSQTVNWLCHAVGVVAADWVGGGPHVNPAVTCSMHALGKCSYTEAFVRVAGAMAGGLLAFPLFLIFADQFGLERLGGPEFDSKDDEEGLAAGFSEFCATVLLMLLIYALNWELDFGKYHYWIKQTLTAVGIRYLIETFPTAGPAMNPMLGTGWYIFANGEYPRHPGHYFTYWVASCAGALLASCLYVVYAGGTVYGRTLPVGPMKGGEEKPAAGKPEAKKEK